MGEPSYEVPPVEKPAANRLDSWKEIAEYLNRDVTTVERTSPSPASNCTGISMPSVARCTR